MAKDKGQYSLGLTGTSQSSDPTRARTDGSRIGRKPSADPSGTGSTLTVLGTNRIVPGIVMTEDEIERIADSSTFATVLFALASFFGSFAISTLIDRSLAVELTPAGELAVLYVPIFAGVIAFVTLAMGVFSWRGRKSMIERIREQMEQSKQ